MKSPKKHSPLQTLTHNLTRTTLFATKITHGATYESGGSRIGKVLKFNNREIFIKRGTLCQEQMPTKIRFCYYCLVSIDYWAMRNCLWTKILKMNNLCLWMPRSNLLFYVFVFTIELVFCCLHQLCMRAIYYRYQA